MGALDGSASPGEWLTPTVPNGGRTVPAALVASKGMTSEGTKRTIDLSAQTTHWMTPSVSNSQGNEYTRDRGQAGQERQTLTGQASNWPTPSASIANDGETPETWHARAEKIKAKGINGNGAGLPLTVAAVQWPTPASRDFRTPNSQDSQDNRKHTGGEQLPNFVEHNFSSHRVLSTLDGRELSPTARTLRRRLNPAFACWLMGWPIWWTNPGLTSCARSAMESYRCRLQQHLCSFFAEPALLEREAA